VLTSDTAYDILKKDVLDNRDRDIKLHRDFTNLLLISLPSPTACIHIIDGSLPVYSENDALIVQRVGAYSRVDRIIPNGSAPTPPAQIFGAEPAHTWCYYYQKAALARQTGDWEEIGKLYDQATKLKLEAGDKSELMPFFEALVNLGRLDEARTLFNKEIKGREKMRFPLCEALSKDPNYPAEFRYDYKTISEMLCHS
jgi:tetratricopeptide (TPR) repeat protein